MCVVLQRGLLLCMLGAVLCAAGCASQGSAKVMVTPFVLKSSQVPPAQAAIPAGSVPCTRGYEHAMSNQQLN
jgi:hypothetical protein